jgi:hypothetical protein
LPWKPQKQVFNFIPPFNSRAFVGLLQEDRGTQFEVFEDDPTKSWNVARPTLH